MGGTNVKRIEGDLYYATASQAIPHGTVCTEDGICGIALKQKQAPIATPLFTTIAVGEDFAILCKGEIECDALGGADNGELVYVDESDNSLTQTADSHPVLGRVTAQAGERGTPTGRMKVNLDLKT